MPTPQRRRDPGGWRGNLNFNARGRGEPAPRGDAGGLPRATTGARGGPTKSRRARARPRAAAAARRGGTRTPRRPTAAPSPVGPLAGGPTKEGHAGARAHTAFNATERSAPLWARARRGGQGAPRALSPAARVGAGPRPPKYSVTVRCADRGTVQPADTGAPCSETRSADGRGRDTERAPSRGVRLKLLRCDPGAHAWRSLFPEGRGRGEMGENHPSPGP